MRLRISVCRKRRGEKSSLKADIKWLALTRALDYQKRIEADRKFNHLKPCIRAWAGVTFATTRRHGTGNKSVLDTKGIRLL
jgi:hypothetical protein